MKNDKVPITLRLDGDIHQALKLISIREMRSLNTQIEYMLRNAILDYFDNPSEMFGTPLGKVISRISSSVDKSTVSDIPLDEE